MQLLAQLSLISHCLASPNPICPFNFHAHVDCYQRCQTVKVCLGLGTKTTWLGFEKDDTLG